ncbi:MAG: glycine cleavage system aminomethyltransferase GcvT [Candidatus Thermoplasmatota archaeon]|nr:glycine cleavage system aminomethyltransferase GcvT [Candidatus Thermoplasmatota archaeon]
MNRTPLHGEHVALGGKMVWFAGWEMPIQYRSVIEEHLTVRKSCGAFDVSHMGDFIIRGEGVGDLIDTLMTNDVRRAPQGKCVYSHLLDEHGHILDDTIATPLGPDEYFMVPNAATTSKMRKWVDSHLKSQELVDMSMDLAAIAVQGPTAKDVLASLTTVDLSKVGFFWAAFARLDRIQTRGSEPETELLKGREYRNGPGDGIKALVSRTGYTGEDGFEIICENADAVDVWRAVLERGKAFGVEPIGLGARDTLRLEKALLLSGTDFEGAQTSLQTGPSWVVDWKHDFLGKSVLEEQKASKDYDKLVCMMATDRGIPRHGYDIMMDGSKVGRVTSGTLSPVLRKGIAMGYVPIGMSKVGTKAEIKVRDTLVSAEVVKPPFVKGGLE